jgi:hypothetical protein
MVCGSSFLWHDYANEKNAVYVAFGGSDSVKGNTGPFWVGSGTQLSFERTKVFADEKEPVFVLQDWQS